MKIPTGPGRKSAAISTSRWSRFAASTSCARPTSKARKATLFLFSVVVLLEGGAAAARGQSALDGFDPNANDQIKVVVVQPDGKILLGGAFTTLSPNGGAPVTRKYIARLNPDGTLDTAFNPNANNWVRSIALQTDGKILVGGDFNGANSIGGQSRNYIARLDATTGAADSFNPNASDFILSIAVQADGKILAGGGFFGANSIGGQTRNYIARLDATTGLADSFNPNANLGGIYSIAVQADGKILAGGGFTSIGGQTRNRIARLDATTGLADSFNPNANDVVRSIALQTDGKILAGGDFVGAIGGQTRNGIARLDATTGLADSFNPNANGEVLAIAVQADGKILAGGSFFTIGGQTRNRIARLNPDGTLDTGFNPNANSFVYSIAVQPDGKILAGGELTSIGGQTRNRIARLEIDGRVDQTLNLSIVGSAVYATAVQPDGKILVGGGFSSVLGVPRNNIARLNTDGTLDTDFNPNANSAVYAIAVQANGKILVCGNFVTIGGQTRNHIARLDATGLADSFNPNATGDVSKIVVQPDGRILVGGSFTAIGGLTRNRIARLNATTGVADSFNPNANDTVLSIAIQEDGKILAGGAFTGTNSIGGQTRDFIARLDATTGLADSFNPKATATVYSIAIQADGKILAGGNFSGTKSIGGQARNHLARLDAVTGLADSFDPNASGDIFAIALQADGKILAGGGFTTIGGATRNHLARLDPTTGLADLYNPNANGDFFAIAVQADGKILAGGGYTSIGGQPRNRLARLSNDTAALQNLAVTQTAINWTLGGSSPQFTRVIFDSSTDNMNYSSLGKVTGAGSNWTLTGLNLSTGQNFYIRARGYQRTAFFNGSESITESVRNAFIAGPSPTPTPPPVITSPLTASATIGQQFTYQFEATGATLLAVTNLPGGLTFNSNLAAITGTPTTIGTFPVGLDASNAGGNTKRTLTLTVQPAPPSGPVIVTGTSATGIVGKPFTFQVTTTGGGPSTSVSASGLPPGLSIDAITGLISGTPTTEGSSAVTLTATNGNLTTTSSLQLTFTADGSLPVIVSASTASAASGQSFSYTIEAFSTSDPETDPTTFALIGPLPAGLSFNPKTGMISGIFMGNAQGIGPPDWKRLSGGIVTNVQMYATNSHGTSTLPLIILLTQTGAVNIATRLTVGTDENVLIAGFIITGNAPKRVIIRAIGPSLNAFGIANSLQDTTLELHEGENILGENDDWRHDQENEIMAEKLAPSDDRESAIFATLAPNKNYTAIVTGKNNTGIALVEVYDLGTVSPDSSSNSKLANIATRGPVLAGDNVMIGGFIVSGRSSTFVVRAIGPSLSVFGITGTLQDPTLALKNADGVTLIGNDDWQQEQSSEIQELGLAPTDPRESALVATLGPGQYTAVVGGKNDSNGVALVEVYGLE
jgi:uncharacterized delta-60 repeat protein